MAKLEGCWKTPPWITVFLWYQSCQQITQNRFHSSDESFTIRSETSCKKSLCAVPSFWNLPKLPAQTSWATPQLQRTCRTDSVSCWQKQHWALANTLLRIRLSCVGKISRHALHEKTHMWNQRVFPSLKQMIDCNYEIHYTE